MSRNHGISAQVPLHDPILASLGLQPYRHVTMARNPTDVSWMIPEDNAIALHFDDSLDRGTMMAAGEFVLRTGNSIIVGACS